MSLLLFTFRNGKQILIRQVNFTVKGGFFFFLYQAVLILTLAFQGYTKQVRHMSLTLWFSRARDGTQTPKL